MGAKIEYKKGDKVGECVFIKETDPIPYFKQKENKLEYIRKAIFKCKCGKVFESHIVSVKRKNTKSCGCLHIQKTLNMCHNNKTHGKANHPLYHIWQSMKYRCYNKNSAEFKNYGGRGIRVCEEWLDINNFINDMYPTYKKGLQLDRKDNNKSYSFNNCNWITPKQNSNNKRNNKFVIYNNNKKTISQWSEHTNIPYMVLFNRLINWSVEEALTVPYPCNNNYIRKLRESKNIIK